MLLQSANLALRFLLELAALGALAYWGSRTGSVPITKLGLGIGTPLLARRAGDAVRTVAPAP